MSGENKRNVRPVKVGGLVLDGKKIYIQSMLNVPSTDCLLYTSDAADE